jgi:hypothetical protein
MSQYRRDYTPGATYFFTVVAYRRREFLCDDDIGRDGVFNPVANVSTMPDSSNGAEGFAPDISACLSSHVGCASRTVRGCILDKVRYAHPTGLRQSRQPD